MNFLKYYRILQRIQGKTGIRIITYAFVGIILMGAMYTMVGFYESGSNAPMAILEFDIEDNHSRPYIENATLDLEHVKLAQIPSTDMGMPLPGVGIIVFNNQKRASYASTQSYTGPGHYRFDIGFAETMPQYNDTLVISVSFHNESGRFKSARILAKWRWNESEY